MSADQQNVSRVLSRGASAKSTPGYLTLRCDREPASVALEKLSPGQYVSKALEALQVDPGDKKRPQRRRGVSFRDEYRALKNARSTRARAPSMIHEPTKEYMVPPQRRELKNKLTVVLDLDETLIYARDGPLYARPHLDLLFSLLRDHCETIVWTAGVKSYAQTIIRNIDPEGTIEHCIYRHKKWFSGRPGYQKDLSMLGRNMDHVIIIENTPDCIRGNPSNGILVADYVGQDFAVDPTIPTLTRFLAKLIESGKTVPEFLSSSDVLAVTEMMTDIGDTYEVFTLNCKQCAATGENRINRDLLTLNTADLSNNDGLQPVPITKVQSGTTLGAASCKAAPADELRSGYVNGLMKGAVALNVPLSPGGTIHNDWINCVAT